MEWLKKAAGGGKERGISLQADHGGKVCCWVIRVIMEIQSLFDLGPRSVRQHKFIVHVLGVWGGEEKEERKKRERGGEEGNND